MRKIKRGRMQWLAILWLLAAGLTPAFADTVKIGFVDLNRALRELPEARKAAAQINREVDAKQKDIDAKRRKIEAFQQALEKDFAKLTPTQRQEREAELQSMIIDLQKYQRDAQDSVNFQRNQVLKKLQDQLVQVVGTIGRAGHYTVILNDKSVLYVNGAVDVTDQVVAALKAREKNTAAGGGR